MRLAPKLIILFILVVCILYITDSYKNFEDLNLNRISSLFASMNYKDSKVSNLEQIDSSKVSKNDKGISDNDSNTENVKNVESRKVVVYFLKYDQRTKTTSFKGVKREIKGIKTVDGEDSFDSLYVSLEKLLQGPSKFEQSKGYYSEIPLGTKLRSVRKNGKHIIVDLSSDFQYGGGTDSINSRIKQLIKTILHNETGLDVFLYIEGKQADVLGGEGIIIKQPLEEGSLND